MHLTLQLRKCIQIVLIYETSAAGDECTIYYGSCTSALTLKAFSSIQLHTITLPNWSKVSMKARPEQTCTN